MNKILITRNVENQPDRGSGKWKPGSQKHFTALKIFKGFVGLDPSVVGFGQYTDPELAIDHFKSSTFPAKI